MQAAISIFKREPHLASLYPEMFKIAGPVMFSLYSSCLCGFKYRFSRNQSKSNSYFLLNIYIRRLKKLFYIYRKQPSNQHHHRLAKSTAKRGWCLRGNQFGKGRVDFSKLFKKGKIHLSKSFNYSIFQRTYEAFILSKPNAFQRQLLPLNST